MQRLLLLALILVPIVAVAQDDVPLNVREARHSIIPFLGYQATYGDQAGLDYSLQVEDPNFPGEVFGSSYSSHWKFDRKSPVVGLQYRYRITDAISADATVTFFQDRQSRKATSSISAYGYSLAKPIFVLRGNTTAWTIGGSYRLSTPLEWLNADLHGAIGFAYRSLSHRWEWEDTQGYNAVATVTDPTDIFVVRLGADANLWKSDFLVLQGALDYWLYFPNGSGNSSYSGVGYRFGIFPLWSGN